MTVIENGTRLVAQHTTTGDLYVISVMDDGVWECVGPVSQRELATYDLDEFNLDSEGADEMNMTLGAYRCLTQAEYRAEHGLED